jgi:Cu/Ag efflux protein CusF
MELARKLVETIHAFRKESGVKVKTPFKKLSYKGPSELSKEILQIVLDEVNVYELEFAGKNDLYTVSGESSEKNQDLIAGKAREIIRNIQEERKKINTLLTDKVIVTLPEWPEEFEKEIKRQALVSEIKKGDIFTIVKV